MSQGKKVIKKTDWKSNFYLIGTPEISEDYTFKIDEHSKNSDWVYNGMNLGVWCGEKCGTVYADCMGGYSEKGDTVIYAHGKKDDGSDDFDAKIVVNWDDRFNEDVLEQIGDLCFIKVGLEKTNDGKIFEQKFLSEYDAIAYVKEHLKRDMVIYVSGNLKYSSYNDVTQVKKNITYIGLSIDKKTKQPTTSDRYTAHFTQSILIDKESASLKKIDKEKSVMYVDAKVLDYVKEVNGVEVKGQYPYNKQFEFEVDLKDEQLCKSVYDKVFKVKKGVTQINFEGEFIEGGAASMPTLDDIDEKIKSLIGVVYTEEEALAACVANNKKERRMVLKKPHIKLVGEEKLPVLQMFPEKYTEEDLVLDYLYGFHNAKEEEVPFDTEEDDSGDSSMDWLNSL